MNTRMKIKKEDTVVVISGKDKGKVGKIIRTVPALARVVIEGVNMKKKHMRAKKGGKKGEIVQFPGPVSSSSVKLVCPQCKKGTRVGYTMEGKKKVRICKKCKNTI